MTPVLTLHDNLRVLKIPLETFSGPAPEGACGWTKPVFAAWVGTVLVEHGFDMGRKMTVVVTRKQGDEPRSLIYMQTLIELDYSSLN